MSSKPRTTDLEHSSSRSHIGLPVVRGKLPKVFFFFILVLTVFNFISFFRQPQPVVLGEQVNLENEKIFWQEMVFKHPTYSQAWEELSKVEEKLGNPKEAQEAANTAKQISPNLP